MIIKKIVLILTLIVFKITLAQTFEGRVVYQVSIDNKAYITHLKEKSKLPERAKMASLRDALNAESLNFFLLFKGNESLYHAEFDMDMLRDMKMKINDTGTAAADDETCYVNLKTKENFRQSFFLDKIIINVEPIQWELTQETKKIGKYTCYKATATLKEEREGGGYLSDPIVAWYTLEIPVPFGVRSFSGLPGLTLELTQDTEKGKLFYKAIKIELNPKNKIVIKKPKGKAISHKEFIELISRPRR